MSRLSKVAEGKWDEQDNPSTMMKRITEDLKFLLDKAFWELMIHLHQAFGSSMPAVANVDKASSCRSGSKRLLHSHSQHGQQEANRMYCRNNQIVAPSPLLCNNVITCTIPLTGRVIRPPSGRVSGCDRRCNGHWWRFQGRWLSEMAIELLSIYCVYILSTCSGCYDFASLRVNQELHLQA